MSAFGATTGAIWGFFLFTIIVGGVGALATGNTVAKAWHPFARVPVYALGLALVISFLHYALFANAVIPASRIAGDLTRLATTPAAALFDLAAALFGLAVTFALLLGAAALGFYRRRASQMVRQYPWLFRRKGLLGWQTVEIP